MISPITVAKAIIHHIIGLPLPAIWRWYIRHDSGRNDQVQIGAAMFYGPPDFISCCQRAMDRLVEIDEDVFFHFTAFSRVSFWLLPPTISSPAWNEAARFYSISSAFYGWREDGIIAFLIYVFFREQFVHRILGVSTCIALQGTSAMSSTAKWLQAHDFPEPLVSTFICDVT